MKESTKPKRKAPTTIIGNLSDSKNQETLQTTSCKKALKLNAPIPAPIPSTSTSNKENSHPNTPNFSPSEDEMDIAADESLCCVCDRRMPIALQSSYVIEFVQWAQCDRCDHWTHLKYCCKTRCLRRGQNSCVLTERKINKYNSTKYSISDFCSQHFHLGRYIVGCTIGDTDLRFCMCIAMN